MPFEFIQVPAQGGSSGQEELNRLLRSGRIVSVRKEFVAAMKDTFWAFCVEFLGGAMPAAPSSDSPAGTKVPGEMIFAKAPSLGPTEPAPRPFIEPKPSL
jgi:hypothetical protein